MRNIINVECVIIGKNFCFGVVSRFKNGKIRCFLHLGKPSYVSLKTQEAYFYGNTIERARPKVFLECYNIALNEKIINPIPKELYEEIERQAIAEAI